MGTTYFRGRFNIGDVSITEAIEDNIIAYTDWCFLEMGAFFNTNLPASGAFGGDLNRLRPVVDPRYTDGQIWESYRQNWVWESGISNVSTQPISISGIFVNNSFIPRGSGYSIDYKHGRIIFDTAQSTTSTVKLEYSHKWINIVGASEVPFLRTGQTRSFRADDNNFLTGSGDWNSLSDTRLQLPLIAVEMVDKTHTGYQLGGGQWSRGHVILHILSENAQTTKRIASILSEQNDSVIYMFDPDMLAREDKYPLNYIGDLNENPLCYPDLIVHSGDGGFRFTSKVQGGKLRIYDVIEQNHGKVTENVYHSTVRWGTEVILPRI